MSVYPLPTSLPPAHDQSTEVTAAGIVRVSLTLRSSAFQITSSPSAEPLTKALAAWSPRDVVHVGRENVRVALDEGTAAAAAHVPHSHRGFDLNETVHLATLAAHQVGRDPCAVGRPPHRTRVELSVVELHQALVLALGSHAARDRAAHRVGLQGASSPQCEMEAAAD